jgi:hypothetical protein
VGVNLCAHALSGSFAYFYLGANTCVREHLPACAGVRGCVRGCVCARARGVCVCSTRPAACMQDYLGDLTDGDPTLITYAPSDVTRRGQPA